MFPYGNIFVFSSQRTRIVDIGKISSLIRASPTPVMREMPVELALIKGEVGSSSPLRPPFTFRGLLALCPRNLNPQSNPHLSDFMTPMA
jgi:hypothetical protein